MRTMMHAVLALSVTAVMMAGASIWVAGKAFKEATATMQVLDVVEAARKEAVVQQAVAAPVVATWWAQHCFGKGAGDIPRSAYETCIEVYRWMVDNQVGPFEEVE